MNFKQSLFGLLQKRYFSSNPGIKQKSKNHYDSLGVDKSATQADVKTAYYELSKMYHPDKNQGCGEASRKFREVSEAYEVLGNAKTRRMYDKGLYVDSTVSADTEDGLGKFYRSRDIRTRPPPPTGRTPIYDFDEWSRRHYGATFTRSQETKSRREWHRQQKERENEIRKTERMVFLMMAVGITCVYLLSRESMSYDVVVGTPVVRYKDATEE